MNGLTCQECKATYPLNDLRWRCDCGGLLDLDFTGQFNREALKDRKPTLWRYREALPLDPEAGTVTFDEGFTPLVEAEFDGRRLLVKLEFLFPTGSFKDRGAAVMMSHAKALGVERVVEDSSGNAGCAVAAYGARAGIACDIYVPESTSPAKLAQIERYGATLQRVPGSREKTARAAREAAEHVFYASHVWNPIFFHGTKTFAYEVWEQLGFRAPDTVIVPTGNGTLLIGAALGFRELYAAGQIPRLPRLIAVQAGNCAPLYRADQEGRGFSSPPEMKETLAEGIAIAEPARARQMLSLLHETGGEVIAVTDEEIESALFDLCRKGFYVEPTAAVALAGFRKLPTGPEEAVIAPLTGHGLKATEKMLKLSRHP
ncbi:MAG: threonine synthase [Armatimonadetes bacterium]|nr:threonine synthase [Armatimonadota bacterium]